MVVLDGAWTGIYVVTNVLEDLAASDCKTFSVCTSVLAASNFGIF